MVLTVKINYDGDIRRKAMEEVTYNSVVEMVMDSFPDLSLDNLQMKYADEEGDMCTLVPLTFPDFLMTQSTNKVLKIQVSKKTVSPPSDKEISTTGCTAGASDPLKSDTQVKEEKSDSKEGNFEDFSGQSWGHGRHGCGGPYKLFRIIKGLRDNGVLTPQMFASLFIQWLPMIIQRATRKIDKINHMVKAGMTSTMCTALIVLQDHVSRIPALAEVASHLKAIVDQEPNAPLLGDTLRGFLLALQALAFEVQVSFLENLAEALLPIMDDLAAELPRSDRFDHWPQGQTGATIHHGVTCDHCGACPIAGPRWKCTTCPDYDLCGNCFTQKTSIHGSDHDFQCVLEPWKGKGKGCKGWGKGHKGFKGHMFHMFQTMMHAKGDGWKGWGKGFHGESSTTGPSPSTNGDSSTNGPFPSTNGPSPSDDQFEDLYD